MRRQSAQFSSATLRRAPPPPLQVLGRMRSLGMKPALGGFSGHVPKAFADKYPNASLSRSPDWSNFRKDDPKTADFADVYLLEPTDPLFAEVGAAFIKVQADEYGTDHIYQADTYNEMMPPTSDPDYLRRSAAAVYGAMAAADPDAIWLMQGWLFFSAPYFWKAPQVEGYLGGVPKGRMWILDLYSDVSPVWSRTASYYGHPFIFCTLLDFGGKQGLVGDAPTLAKNFGAAIFNDNSTISGVGLTMEGIWTNYPMFEMTLQLGWQPHGAAAASPAWWSRYGARRYGGAADAAAVQAWEILGSGAYSVMAQPDGSPISAMPTINGSACPHEYPAAMPGAAGDGGASGRARDDTFAQAWGLLLRAGGGRLGAVPSYRFDLIDVGREVLGRNFSATLAQYGAAFKRADAAAVASLAKTLLATIDDYDELLATDTNFLLGRWIGWARSWSATAAGQDLLEYNARNQLTLWGPTGQINDYAKKEWAGLVATYYKPRWALFFDHVAKAVGGAWDPSAFCSEVLQTVELPWQTDTTPFPATPTGDALAVSRRMYAKYVGGHFR